MRSRACFSSVTTNCLVRVISTASCSRLRRPMVSPPATLELPLTGAALPQLWPRVVTLLSLPRGDSRLRMVSSTSEASRWWMVNTRVWMGSVP